MGQNPLIIIEEKEKGGRQKGRKGGSATRVHNPWRAALYFNKIQCFCFEEQRLLSGEQIDMLVFFYIDPEFETDPKMDGINNTHF
ncbi:hypothetical protein K7X08_030118 [Anisodus acutangulus]|uniref:Uncharacterized protein n=1 Tax=Anisodus acutangulus TaxID=402998 RepID=A0A9Q1LQR7_9SOLA|nr:hypothetical protein K7X08_030118 [Anisodus acutangulus]